MMASAKTSIACRTAVFIYLVLAFSSVAFSFNEFELIQPKYDPITDDAKYDIDAYVKAKFSKSCYEAKPGDLTERLMRNTKDLKERNCAQRLPQAIIIGVRKCYSGRLLQFLRFHPSVEMRSDLVPLDLFSGAYDNTLELYRKQMPFTTARQLTIEKTPEYFIVPHDVPKITHDLIDPNMKVIAVVCDPVRRAIADYVRVKTGRETEYTSHLMGNTFEETVMQAEREGHVNHLNALIDSGLYFKHFLRWLHYFPQEQMYLLDSKLLTINPAIELKKVEEFLGLPPYFEESHFAFDEQSGHYCIVFPQKVCLQGSSGQQPKRPKVDDDTLKTLYEFFAPYDRSLSSAFGQKLTWTNNRYNENWGNK